MPVPRPALLLGWAGVIPFAGLAAATMFGSPAEFDPRTLLLSYAALILSFMGGAQWGLTTAALSGTERGWRGYVVSVVPALVAWVALLIGGRAGSLVLATSFVALLAYDLWTVRNGYAPRWYASLRLQLTAAVAVLLVAAALAA